MQSLYLKSKVKIIFAATFIATGSASATSVYPLVIDMVTNGGRASGQITAYNASASDRTFEVTVYRAEIDANGEVSLQPAPKDLIIFPPTRIIGPRNSQVFRVEWASSNLPSSRNYIVRLKQLPVKMPSEANGVKVMIDFNVSVNIAPPAATRTLDLVATAVTATESVGADKKPERYPVLTVANAGNSYAKLADASITLRDGAWSKTLTAAEIGLLLGQGIVQPGKTRKFTLKVPMPQSATKVTAEISYGKTMR